MIIEQDFVFTHKPCMQASISWR